MNNKTQIPLEKLIDWLEGWLPADEYAALYKRLQTAVPSQVHADLAWLQSFLALSQEITLSEPPAHVSEQLRQQFQDHLAGQRPPNILQRVAAALTFDSARRPALAGVRGSTGSASRQLVYSADVGDIALNILPQSTSHRVTLYGQIFADHEAYPLHVQLLQTDPVRELALVTTDELGEFTLPELPVTAVSLIISSHQFEITLPPLHLTA
ncbi:MAG: hypothetical protein H6662_07465 [Ardenticatenaceae bacterium]|nr:hypothetical protein [Anaerolineales bacterium]MCB8921403.1 hypothetical protein [Ardenticatenaceae bacterium]MCB8991525.1 hypothetical protein [Ardenticatenaceae bacterium]MCB9005120.1 hypothetical protein [Ardenticatenaceae bacterium]